MAMVKALGVHASWRTTATSTWPSLMCNLDLDELNSLTKVELLRLYTVNTRTEFPADAELDTAFNALNQRVFKALRDYADPENKIEHKTSKFWDLNIKINEGANTYNRVAKTEVIACIFQCLHLDTLGNEPLDKCWIVPDKENPDGPPLLRISDFDLTTVSDELQTHTRRFFPGAQRFDFYLRYKGEVEADGYADWPAKAAFVHARHATLDKIVEVEEMRTQLETHLKAYEREFAKLKESKLETAADSDHVDSSDEEDAGPSHKRQKTFKQMGTVADTSQQNVDLFSVDTSRGQGISSLRVRYFKGEVQLHGLEILGSMHNHGLFHNHLPDPKVPEFTSGAETDGGGLKLMEPEADVGCNTAMTQKLITTGLREPYERMLRLRHDLKKLIRSLGNHLLANFLFLIDVTRGDGSTYRRHPHELSATDKYALGLLYMSSISTPRPPEEDEPEEPEEEEGEEEGEESDEDEYEGSGEESSDEDDESEDESNSDKDSAYDSDEDDDED